MDKAKSFQRLQTIGGVLLFIAAFAAIVITNTPYGDNYKQVINIIAQVQVGVFIISKPLLLWINDGLMAIYFLLVGLEIKREIKRGVLSNITSIVVPLIAAMFGLLVPALIYWTFNTPSELYMRGWAIPTATDIAFTLSILALLGSRVPLSLKVLLTTIAIFDDIAAIIIIALFYTSQLSMMALMGALFLIAVLFLLNYFHCTKISVYLFVGIILWVCVLKSGIHATLAGFILAMAIPDEEDSLLSTFENGLHPWVAFLILPLFAFVNAGVSFQSFNMASLTHPVFLGVFLGLFFGKQIGIFLPLCYFVKYKHYLCYDKVNLKQVYGVALLCGVGFTMSLFIGALAFKGVHKELVDASKAGIVLASILSGVIGYLFLRAGKAKK